MRKASYPELSEKYENFLENPCDMETGMVFVSENGEKPDGLCENAWETMESFVRELSAGGGRFYGDWMKNPHSAMISCNDGFRPVSFLIEAVD